MHNVLIVSDNASNCAQPYVGMTKAGRAAPRELSFLTATSKSEDKLDLTSKILTMAGLMPPFTEETAQKKVKVAQDLWNTKYVSYLD